MDVQEAKHSDFIPSIGLSARLPFTWYGSESVVDQWLDEVKARLARKSSPLVVS